MGRRSESMRRGQRAEFLHLHSYLHTFTVSKTNYLYYHLVTNTCIALKIFVAETPVRVRLPPTAPLFNQCL